MSCSCKTVFIDHNDRAGAIAALLTPLAQSGIGVIAVDAAAAGGGRSSAIAVGEARGCGAGRGALHAS